MGLFTDRVSIQFFMKSGNTFIVNCTEITMDSNLENMRWVNKSDKNKILAIKLDEVEAIIRLN